ncbi:hypothetical protein HAV15_002388 [Penicillium sp. str. |nr:hypothetical protein HAV15_002388 [Penicillium sp. str. \
MIQPAGVPIQEFWNRIKACLTAVQRGRIVSLSLKENNSPPPLPDVGSILDVFILVLVLVLVVIHHQPTVHIRTIPRWPALIFRSSSINARRVLSSNSYYNGRCNCSCSRFSSSGSANLSRLCLSSSPSSSSSLTPIDQAGVNGAIPERRKSTSATP